MASCHMATGYACLVAFDCHNLENVARLAKDKYLARIICICADYDMPCDKYPDAGGIGVAKGKEAAQAIGAYLAVCPPIDGGKADFNDLAAHDGLVRVQEVIEKALGGEPVKSGSERPQLSAWIFWSSYNWRFLNSGCFLTL